MAGLIRLSMGSLRMMPLASGLHTVPTGTRGASSGVGARVEPGHGAPVQAGSSFALLPAGCTLAMLPVAIGLAATGLLPPGAAALAVLTAVIVLGVPHGALDGEFARPLLRPHFGRWWFAVFAVPYLGLTACVLLSWRVAPLYTLAGFLAASVWHFGSEDAGPKPLEAIVRGGLVIAVPALVQTEATARLLGTLAMVDLPTLPTWLVAASVAWCLVAVAWATGRIARREFGSLLEPALLTASFCLLPPLTAFALYFVCLHAPRHTSGVIADPAAPRVGSTRQAVRYAAPVTALTILIGAALWRWFPGAPPERLLALTIEGLSALTLPHMLLDLVVHSSPARGIAEGSRSLLGIRQVARSPAR